MKHIVQTENGLEELTEEQFLKYQNNKKSQAEDNKTYIDKRRKEYGSIEEQLEFITENGLEAWQEKVSEIKLKYPKPNDSQ
ncbi:MAG: hypothetical protein N4A43_02340 [Alphaproteobacteria bacterium]|jgi:hypothetical protein|nr:hypothetical protein [Alphaproteobacteria bacterium]